MQDNYQYKQLGLIYEAMANPSATSDKVKTLKFNGRFTGPLTLRFDKAALQPFIDGQNDYVGDFLTTIGIKVPETMSYVDILQPMEVEYLIDMLNKFAGTNFSYDDVDLVLFDGGPDDDDDQDEDAEGSYM